MHSELITPVFGVLPASPASSGIVASTMAAFAVTGPWGPSCSAELVIALAVMTPLSGTSTTSAECLPEVEDAASLPVSTAIPLPPSTPGSREIAAEAP